MIYFCLNQKRKLPLKNMLVVKRQLDSLHKNMASRMK